MKTTVTKHEFREAFNNMNRSDNFTYEGLGALFDYLEDYEEQTDTEMELDVIACCCEFTEYADIEEVAGEYDLDEDDPLEDLRNNTLVIEMDNGGIIIQCY
jgi:hypothetical protein